MKVFTKKRVISLAALILLVTLFSFLPQLQAPEPSKSPVAQSDTATRKAKWQNLNPSTPVTYWQISGQDKWLGGKTTIGLLLPTKPDGFDIDFPPDTSVENGLIITVITYTSETRYELISQSKFDQVYSSVPDRKVGTFPYIFPSSIGISEISKTILKLDAESNRNEFLLIIGMVLFVPTVLGLMLWATPK